MLRAKSLAAIGLHNEARANAFAPYWLRTPRTQPRTTTSDRYRCDLVTQPRRSTYYVRRTAEPDTT